MNLFSRALRILRMHCILGVCFLSLSLAQCYVAKQARGQLSILWDRRPVADVLEEQGLDEEERRKLAFVQSVRSFAQEKLHLDLSTTFTHYTRLDREVLSWIVQAAKPLELTAKTWYFPIVGRVPYLGYFDLEDARKKEMQLRKTGWDTRIAIVSGYSTLGWFKDPLLSTQLRYTELDLAALVIHEASHATLWVKNDVPFNESMAEFVGVQGSLEFAQAKLGAEALQNYLSVLTQREQKGHVLHDYARRLQELYQSTKADGVKLKAKTAIFLELEAELLPLVGASKDSDYLNVPNLPRMNNAHLLGYLIYNKESKFFEKIYQLRCRQNWPCFWDAMRALSRLNKAERKLRMQKAMSPGS